MYGLFAANSIPPELCPDHECDSLTCPAERLGVDQSQQAGPAALSTPAPHTRHIFNMSNRRTFKISVLGEIIKCKNGH